MSRVAVIGEEVRIRGYALAGAVLFPAEDPQTARAAWQGLPADVGLVVLTAAAAKALAERDRDGGGPLVAVMD